MGAEEGKINTVLDTDRQERTVIVVANRIPVAEGWEEAFEERFRNRAGQVEQQPGFVRMEILRPVESGPYVVKTYWESMAAFRAWTESEDFRAAHADPPPREMFAGDNRMEIHEVALSQEPK
ncbi:Heme-degrading monooxygenase HmoA [Thiohalorhabdus denitrificans]|uniref:Heme-degrading monooxygenase HmoA n=1 Tax=Thiohalorhabdus denitrificans TaxID=381306 RepID=A0A1G5BT01_9GAMM|nr:Heme-degrading monooxygenase HmoA [Thiohalorhabdus denitrificans]